ncbi:hypothetical protein IWX91DRAFT_127289 [Phyllosticta citricarpa]
MTSAHESKAQRSRTSWLSRRSYVSTRRHVHSRAWYTSVSAGLNCDGGFSIVLVGSWSRMTNLVHARLSPPLHRRRRRKSQMATCERSRKQRASGGMGDVSKKSKASLCSALVSTMRTRRRWVGSEGGRLALSRNSLMVFSTQSVSATRVNGFSGGGLPRPANRPSQTRATAPADGLHLPTTRVAGVGRAAFQEGRRARDTASRPGRRRRGEQRDFGLKPDQSFYAECAC